jgi:hypothetical protein
MASELTAIVASKALFGVIRFIRTSSSSRFAPGKAPVRHLFHHYAAWRPISVWLADKNNGVLSILLGFC